MTNHDAVKKMGEAYKALGIAIRQCDRPHISHLIQTARDMIYDVGDGKFGKEFIDELHYSEAD